MLNGSRILATSLALFVCLARADGDARGKMIRPQGIPAKFTGCGVVTEVDGVIRCASGDPMSGVVFTNALPNMNYTVELDAMREAGDDFFIGLTIPVETNHCTVIIGGWGGYLCGVSSIDYMDAADNPYSETRTFQNGRWYHLRVNVTPHQLSVSLDNDFLSLSIPYESSSQFSLRPGSEIETTIPLGLCTYKTTARWKNIRVIPREKITSPSLPAPRPAQE